MYVYIYIFVSLGLTQKDVENHVEDQSENVLHSWWAFHIDLNLQLVYVSNVQKNKSFKCGKRNDEPPSLYDALSVLQTPMVKLALDPVGFPWISTSCHTEKISWPSLAALAG